MRCIFILLISCVLLSCNFNRFIKNDSNQSVMTDSIIDLEKVRQMKLSNPDDYRKTLDPLDHGDLASLNVANTLFNNCIASDTLTLDSMFVVLNDFYNTVAGGFLENNEIVNTQLENSPSSETLNKIRTSLAPFGMSLNSSEGTYFLEPQTGYLLQNFGRRLSTAYREYLGIEIKEQQFRFAEDQTILIPSDSLIARILTWENFMTRNPDFVQIKMAQDQYAQYMGAFLTGMDNSRVFDFNSNRLKDSSKTAFESFILKYPESKSKEVVKSFLELLQSTNFNYTEKVDSFMLERVYH
jgi:hypothetical protein